MADYSKVKWKDLFAARILSRGYDYFLDGNVWDILGILAAHERLKRPLTMNMIDDAVTDLYGSWEEIPDNVQEFIRNVMKDGNYDRMLSEIRESEKETRTILIDFEDHYPSKTNTENVDDIITILRKKKDLENQEK